MLAKPLAALVCLLPLILSWIGGWGKEPAAEVIHDSGYAALNLLLLTLAARPAARLGWTWPMKSRRWLGTASFLYACAHLTAHLWKAGLMPRALWAELLEHPYIAAGLGAFLAMAPLALTSNDESVRRMGPAWGRLHRLAYPAAVLAVIHFVWAMGFDKLRLGVLFYSTAFTAVLLLRLARPSTPAAR